MTSWPSSKNVRSRPSNWRHDSHGGNCAFGTGERRGITPTRRPTVRGGALPNGPTTTHLLGPLHPASLIVNALLSPAPESVIGRRARCRFGKAQRTPAFWGEAAPQASQQTAIDLPPPVQSRAAPRAPTRADRRPNWALRLWLFEAPRGMPRVDACGQLLRRPSDVESASCLCESSRWHGRDCQTNRRGARVRRRGRCGRGRRRPARSQRL
jgi:hypothetical protein